MKRFLLGQPPLLDFSLKHSVGTGQFGSPFSDALLQSLLGLLEFLFRPLAFGDVPQKNHEPPALSRLVLDADFDGKRASILAAVPGLETILALRHNHLEVGRSVSQRLGGLQVAHAHGQQFLFAIAAHPAVGLIDFQQTPLQVQQPESIHRRLENGAVLFLALDRGLVEQPEPVLCFAQLPCDLLALLDPLPSATIAGH